MKKILSGIAFVAASLALSSCADFLDVKPEGNPSQGGFFLSDKDATDAVGGIYWIFDKEETWGRNLFWEQCCSDDVVPNSTSRWPSLMTFQYVGDEGPLTDNWEMLNQYISRANWVVSGLRAKGDVDLLSPVQKRSLGEALFMRAYLHFHIAYRYGRADQGAPFIRYEDLYPEQDMETVLATVPPQRATVMENYELIEQDLDDAAALLPFFETYGADDYGRAHKVAAWALKVKLYAYWAYHDTSKWALIPSLVDKIEVEGNRDLLPNFADVFKIENNYSKEYIWSATGTGKAEGGPRFPGVCLINKGWGIFNGWGSIKPTRSLFEAYEAGDVRREVSIYYYGMPKFAYYSNNQPIQDFTDPAGDAIASGFMFGKYMQPFGYGDRKFVRNDKGEEVLDAASTIKSNPYVSNNGNDMTTDLALPLIRHAEMVLFKAEALIQQGQGGLAAVELNRLAKRAGLGDSKYTTATMDDLMRERRCELAGEFYDRFMDLKRWKQKTILEQPQYDRVPLDLSSPLGATIKLLRTDKGHEQEVYYEGPNILREGSGIKTPDQTKVFDKEAIWPIATDNKRVYEPEYDLVFPYPPLEVQKANGKLKQNPIGR